MTGTNWAAPEPWQVVLCKFPLQETPTLPSSKSRPALIVGIDYRVGTGYYVQVVYGTSQKITPVKIGEVLFDIHSNRAACKAAGLEITTKFHLTRSVELPYQPRFFGRQQENTSPVIGSFTPAMQKQTLAVLAELRRR